MYIIIVHLGFPEGTMRGTERHSAWYQAQCVLENLVSTNKSSKQIINTLLFI